MTFHDEYQARLAVWSDVQYCMPRMHDAARSYPEVKVLELGVREGYSTSAFLAAAESAAGHVWSVDIDEPRVPAHWSASGLWTFTRADDLTLTWPAGMFDVLFIDTSHSYEHTLAELCRFVPVVRPGGTVFLHDTIWGDRGVAGALHVFCAETGLSWTEHGGQYGLGEIRIPPKAT